MTQLKIVDPLILLCKSVTEITPSMREFEFVILNDDGVDLGPGLHLNIRYPNMKGIINERVYSISDYCGHLGTVSIAVRKENSYGVSSAMFCGIKSGTIIHSMGISGDLFGDVSQKYLGFFCSGSGITPVMSILRSLDKCPVLKFPKLIDLFYSVKSIEEAYFLLELLALDLKYPWLRLHLFVTDKNIISDHSYIRQGRMDKISVRELLSEKIDRTYYFGGARFNNAIKTIVNDSEGGSSSEKSSFLHKSEAPKDNNTIRIKSDDSNEKVVYFSENSDKTVLELLERDGINIKSMCGSGFCGTCKVKLEDGEVSCDDVGGLTNFEKSAGYVLACCSKPIGNIEISA